MNWVIKLIFSFLFHYPLNIIHQNAGLLETVLHLLLGFLYLVPVSTVSEIGAGADVTKGERRDDCGVQGLLHPLPKGLVNVVGVFVSGGGCVMAGFRVSDIVDLSLEAVDFSFLISNSIDKGQYLAILFVQLSLILFLQPFYFFFAVALPIRYLSNCMSIGYDSGFGRRQFLRISGDESPSLTGIESSHLDE